VNPLIQLKTATSECLITRCVKTLAFITIGVAFASTVAQTPSLPPTSTPPVSTLAGYAKQQLKAHLVPEASSAKATGRVSPSTKIRLAVGLTIPKDAELQAFIKDVYDPKSPNYRKFLTPETFTAKFAPSSEDYQKVVNWARAQHLEIVRTYPNRLLLDVSGTAADVERAVHVNLELALRLDRSTFFRPDRDPAIDIDVPIHAIIGLDDFERPRHFGGSSPGGNYISHDLRTAYASGSNLKGTGQTIGILALDGYDPADVAAYRTDAGLPPLAPTTVLVGGATGSPHSWSQDETFADIELAMAMAPAANVTVYIGGGTDWAAWCADYVSILNDMATSSPLSLQNSTSYAWCGESSTLSIIDTMAAQGQSFFVPSGDQGGYPANQQMYDVAKVTVVGGTTLTMTGAGVSYDSEVTWDDPTHSNSSGGGVEYEIAIPSWQAGTTFASGSDASTTNRNDPDVAMAATDLYIRAWGSSAYFRGTSAGPPLWAGFMALVNERWALAGMTTPVGWASPAIWNLGRTPAAYSIAFNDITTGTATSYSGGITHSAGTGYDLTTGWGTPKPPLIDQIACVNLTGSGVVQGTPPLCDNSIGTSLGDTHLSTFNGLLYDFQASGDFVLAQVDPDFVVQTRQVSGAPTWPNATVNHAVATRMGQTKVAICIAPVRLNVNGSYTDLADGKTLSAPDGVDVSRTGNVYFIRNRSGDSVRAELNPTWINVSVGVGRWGAKMRGLLANANGNINQIETRDRTVLTSPFSFEDLYHRYADSWRVSPKESLLTGCGDGEIESGIPQRPFYANDLDPKLRERTQAVCTTAGVKVGPLLDACTLDVAVIGNEGVAKVFVSAPAPFAVGNITATSNGPGLIGWLLLLFVLAVIVIILWMLLIRKKRTIP
jgi:hypothetical protein